MNTYCTRSIKGICPTLYIQIIKICFWSKTGAQYPVLLLDRSSKGKKNIWQSEIEQGKFAH